MNKKTYIKSVSSDDLNKMKQNLQNFEKSSKVAIRFALTNFIKSCVDSQSKNKVNCHCLVEADGIRIMIETCNKLGDSVDSINKIIIILNSVLTSL